MLPYTSASVINGLEEEYLDYQLMDSKEIPAEVWDSALVKVKEGQEYHRMDIIWAYLGSIRNPDGMLRYSKLANVAKLILVQMLQKSAYLAW